MKKKTKTRKRNQTNVPRRRNFTMTVTCTSNVPSLFAYRSLLSIALPILSIANDLNKAECKASGEET